MSKLGKEMVTKEEIETPEHRLSRILTACQHDEAERDYAAVMDEKCPLCLCAELTRLCEENERLKAFDPLDANITRTVDGMSETYSIRTALKMQDGEIAILRRENGRLKRVEQSADQTITEWTEDNIYLRADNENLRKNIKTESKALMRVSLEATTLRKQVDEAQQGHASQQSKCLAARQRVEELEGTLAAIHCYAKNRRLRAHEYPAQIAAIREACEQALRPKGR